MSFIVRGIAILVGIIFIGMVIAIMKRRMLSEVQSIGWLIGGAAIVVLGIFPELVGQLANMFGIWYAPTMITILAIVLIFGIVFHNTLVLSKLTNQINELTMQVSLLKSEIEEKETSESKGGDFY